MKELTVKESQAVAAQIMQVIADICEKNNWRYYLMYGTLIGAIRHKGFIPWDDDLDIMMPRKDHDALMDYLKEHIKEYPNLRVFNREICEEYPYMITRISDDRYKIDMKNEKDFGMGLFIDIYPFDGLGKTEKEALSFGLKGDRLSSLCYQATRSHFAIETTTSPFRKLIKYPVYLVSKMIGKDFFQKRLQKLANVKDFDAEEYVGCIVWLSGGMKDIFKREWFDEYQYCEFDGYQFRIPKQYDTVLRHGYGNYMELPPEKDRVGHHEYKVYQK